MRSLVNKYPASFAAPRTPPGALVVVGLRAPPGRDDPAGVADCANPTAADDLLDPAVQRVVALVKHDRERQLRLRRRDRVQLFDLLGVHAGRLLQQNMNTLL